MGCLGGTPDTPDAGVGTPPTSSGATGGATISSGGSTGATWSGVDGGSVSLPDGAAGGDASSTTSSGSTGGSGRGAPGGGTGGGDDAGAAPVVDGGKSGAGYQVDLSQTSVSGFSSGAFFAVQFHVAFSSIMKGAAVFAGGPYDCAQGSANTAETTCMTGSPDVSTLVTATKQAYSSGTIDDPANLANEAVFIFGGADDTVVHPTVVDALDNYYASFMSSSSIKYESRHAGASHTMPTLSYGGSCDSVVAPYVGDCSYDGAGTALQQIYGALAAPATTLSGKTLSFSQATFDATAATDGLAATGYYYVPASCASGEACKVHVSFHGCQQNAAAVGDAYYDHAGYNEWADTNHIIVLYPQATSSSGNDYGCWDFWGYDGASYATRTGKQAAAVRAMIGWLAGGGTTDAGAAPAKDAGGGGTGTGGLPDAGAGATGSGAGSSSCITATNPAQVAAGRAHALAGYAYATGSDAFLGADTAATSSSLEETATGYYVVCL